MILALEPAVQVALVATGGTVATAVLGLLVEMLRRQHSTLAEVRDQVSNTHSTNLRDDLDAVMFRLDRVIDGQASQARAIDRLSDDIALERRERLAVAERLDDHMAANAAG